MSSEPARAIAKLGFRRWYERQLIEAHAWLVTSLLVAIVIAVSAEGVSFKRPFAEVVPTILLLFFGGLICWHAVKRFLALMGEANRLAEHSTCEACGAYGLFRVTQQYPEKMRVCCRKCSNEWMLG